MLLTIVTVVRNGGNVINRCLESIATLKKSTDVEHLIVDGNSTDDTLEICNKFDCKIIMQSGNGIYNAMNLGIEKSKGEFVLFVNADDYIDIVGLLEAVKVLKKEPEFNHLFSINLKLKEITSATWNPIKTFDRRHSMPAPHPGMIIRRELLKENLGFDESYRYSADYHMALRLQQVQKVKCHNLVISNFQIGGASSNFTPIIENIKIRWKSKLNFYDMGFGFLYDIYRYFHVYFSKK